jgi:[acyl-carrier-protein] S-malonyltransferase
MTLAFTFGGGMAMEAPGMGLHDRFPVFRDWFAQVAEWTDVPADRLLTEDFTAAFYSGDVAAHPDFRFVAEARQAAYSIGIADVLAERGIRPDVIGGSSLGFMIGATLAGSIGRRDLFAYLRHSTGLPLHPDGEEPRGIAVCVVPHDEGPEGFRGDRQGVHLACEIGQFVDGRNGMYMYSGTVDAMREFAAAKPLGHVNVVTVLGGAHSPLQQFHHDLMAPYVAGMTFRDPTVPLISGLSDRTLTTADEVRTDLLRNSVTTTQVAHVISGLKREGTELALVLGVASAVGMFTFPFPVFPLVTPEDFDSVGAAVYDAGIQLTF